MFDACKDCENPIETDALAVEGYCGDCNAAWEKESADAQAEQAFDYAIAIGAV